MINIKDELKHLDYFKSFHEKDIAKEFFKEFTTGSEVSRILYPNAKRKKNVGIVSNNLNLWKKLGYIEINNKLKITKDNKNGKKYSQKMPHCRLNLKFFFNYASKADFDRSEIELINKIFSFEEIRKRACLGNNLIEGIESVLAEIFLISPRYDKLVTRYFLSRYYGDNAKKIVKQTGNLYIKEHFGSMANFNSLSKQDKDRFLKKMQKFIIEDLKKIRNSWDDEIESIGGKILILRGLDKYNYNFYWNIIKEDKIIFGA